MEFAPLDNFMVKRITNEIFISQCKSIHDNKYNYDKTKYVYNNIKVKIKCPRHGIFLMTPCDHKNGHGCKKCYYENNKTWSLEEDGFIKKNYVNKSALWLSNKLNKSESAVRSRLHVLGLCKTGFSRRKGHAFIPAIIWNGILIRAKKSGHDVNIDCDYIYSLFLKQNCKCALTGWNITFSKNKKENTASVDRIDSYKGYIVGNIQITHKSVNKCKLNYHQKLFFEICKAVFHNMKDKMEDKQLIWEEDAYSDTIMPITNIVPCADIEEMSRKAFTLKKSE